MVEKRQLSENEKKEVLKKHGRRCFIDGEPISEEETIEYHHIKAFSKEGPTNIDNIAPVCRRHHLSIGTMSLQEYRDKLELGCFFEGEPKYLDHVIKHKKGIFGEKFQYETDDKKITFYFKDVKQEYPIHKCPTTNWDYLYATLPIEYLKNDKELQPRAIREASMWRLYRHFQRNTQISPSICRIDSDGDILLFDGQHKAAAQIWAGRKNIECKVYLCPDEKILKETNLEAHGQFRQMSFYSHELMKKYADIFGEDWTEYMERKGPKSEKEFLNFLINAKGKTKAQARNEISMAMYNEIVDEPSNKLSGFLSEKSRGRKQPLSFARLKKTFFQNMLIPPPVEAEFESDADFRKEEKANLIKLMNIIAAEGLQDKWGPERNDATHKKAEKIFSAGAVRAWVILLRDTINIHLKHYTDEERRQFFYRHIPDDEFEYFKQFVKKIFSHKIWDDPDPSGEIAARLSKDDATTAKSLFEEHNLTAHWVLGA